MKRTNVLVCGAVLLATLIGSGGVYAEEQTQQVQNPDPASASTPLTADLTTPEQTTPKPPADPANPDNTENKPVDGGVTGEKGNLGIAYYPKAFSFKGTLGESELELSDSGSNPSSTGTTYNIGVKDNTRQHNSWTLTAQLNWDLGSELPGSTITVTNPNSGKVKFNTNNGVSNFSTSDLVTQSDVHGEPTVTVSSIPATVMKKESGTVGKGTYDYSLGTVGTLKLTIPSATDLEAKQYSGKVDWNLQMTPDATSAG
ncbi:WxL domain-containing protein [Enterococcus hirae]